MHSTFDHIMCICHAIPRDCKYLEDRYCGVHTGAHTLYACVCVCVSLHMHSYIFLHVLIYMYINIYIYVSHSSGTVKNAKYLTDLDF